MCYPIGIVTENVVKYKVFKWQQLNSPVSRLFMNNVNVIPVDLHPNILGLS